jgi:hypothetical protein
MSNVIQLPHKFQFRDYQVDPWNAFVRDKMKRGMLVVPRRNGKDILCWNILIAKAFEHVGLYYYMAPYYNQVRQIIWEGYTKDGMRFLDYIPEELIANKTKLDMRIDLVNGSQIKLQGSDQIDRIVGTNPYGIVFTEFSLHKPGAWEYLRPILAENGGWAIFNGTPRSLNHFHDLYQKANKDDDWYVQYLTRDDTGVPTLEAIDDDRRSGMPEALIKQEYYSSFMSGVVGSYYADYIEKAREDNRITSVPYETKLPVYTFWDLGVGDATAIWFAQIKGREVRFIDYYEASGEGVPHYIKVLQEKPYVYDEHFAPHDIEVREFSTGVSRRETAAGLGLDFTVVPKQSLEDGIEASRELIAIAVYDSDKCADGLNALMNYKKRFNEVTQSYSNTPVHDWSSNGADSHRYAGLSIPLIVDYSYSHVNNRFEPSTRRPTTVITAIRRVGKRSPTSFTDFNQQFRRVA